MTSLTMAYPKASLLPKGYYNAPLVTPVAARLAFRKPDLETSRNAARSKRSRVRFRIAHVPLPSFWVSRKHTD